MSIIYDNHDLTQHPPDLQGWGSTDPVFGELINTIKPTVIFEIGTWKGASAIHMAKLCKDHNLPTQIYCIDTWLGSYEHIMKRNPEWYDSLRHKNGFPQIYYTFLSNVIQAGVQDHIIPLPMPSEIAADVLLTKNIAPDLIYVDGSHTFRAVKRDIELFWYTLRPGGAMLLDDFNDPNWPGVTAAIKAFDFKSRINSDTGHKAWIFRP